MSPVLLKVVKQNGLYVLEVQTKLCSVVIDKGTEDRTLIWKKCMGHISDK